MAQVLGELESPSLAAVEEAQLGSLNEVSVLLVAVEEQLGCLNPGKMTIVKTSRRQKRALGLLLRQASSE